MRQVEELNLLEKMISSKDKKGMKKKRKKKKKDLKKI